MAKAYQDGAGYFEPATPCDRLLAHSSVTEGVKAALRAKFQRLDPVQLLREIRAAQQALSDFAAHGVRTEIVPPVSTATSDVAQFLASLSSAWKEGVGSDGYRRQRPANDST